MKENITDAFFYHIYPLGMCGAPSRNDFCSPAGSGLRMLCSQLDRITSLGVNAVYIGPLFESTSHGYDTVDYYHVDRRLGNNDDLASFTEDCHRRGIQVILDAVLNHTGRDFFAFKDIIKNGRSSRYVSWYKNIDFEKRSPYGDSFSYDDWAGCADLVKLNLDDREVRDHLLGAVRMWIREFHIDGLRLDAADVLAPDFMDELAAVCASEKPGFWLMGEVVTGDYNGWARPGRLDSVTNYELYKGLWSSFNTGNFFELAWTLNRQFGDSGLYRYAPLYTFADNHDVNRIASTLSESAWLYPLYGLVFTVPGIPSVYYGSEYGIRGLRTETSDRELRPAVPPFVKELPDYARPAIDGHTLEDVIRRLASLRHEHEALRTGTYRQIAVSHRQFAFMRCTSGEQAVIAVNSELKNASVALRNIPEGTWTDVLNGGTYSAAQLGNLELPSSFLRILIRK